ncbi:MAG TPA: HAD family hydrolase [Acidimicrobiia bacterium]|nr:HAD family hydrolase [Acidimicrobiia bacterium]
MLEAIVFDFDGVILESADVKTDAFIDLYAHHGPAVTAKVREHHLANLGISRFKKFAWISENVLGERLGDDASAALGRRFSELALAKVLAAPFVTGAEGALTALRVPLFVASGTPQDELTMIVERRGLTPRFREVHGSPSEKPAVLRGLMQRHSWSRDQVLFIGDGYTDYEAAVDAGVEFLARDTPALHDRWMQLGVRRAPDLSDLAARVAAW